MYGPPVAIHTERAPSFAVDLQESMNLVLFVLERSWRFNLKFFGFLAFFGFWGFSFFLGGSWVFRVFCFWGVLPF